MTHHHKRLQTHKTFKNPEILTGIYFFIRCVSTTLSSEALAQCPSSLCARIISPLVKHFYTFMWHEEASVRLDSPQIPSQLILVIVVEKETFQGNWFCAEKFQKQSLSLLCLFFL